jgi:hypothetical protein
MTTMQKKIVAIERLEGTNAKKQTTKIKKNFYVRKMYAVFCLGTLT